MATHHRLGRPVTVKASLRIFIVGATIAAVLFAGALWWIVTTVDQIGSLQAERHQDTLTEQQRESAIIAANKAEAFADVAQLACSLVELYPPQTSPFLDKLRATYKCAPYAVPTGTTNALPTGHSSGHPAPTPAASATPQADLPAFPSPTSTPTPLPSVTVTRTVTAPVPTLPLAAVSSAACSALGILCR